MKSKKSLIARIIAIIIIIPAVALMVRNKDKSENLNASPASNTIIYDASYQAYLNRNGYEGVILDNQAEVDLNNYTVTGDMIAEMSQNGLATGDAGSISWSFTAPEDGFYNLEIGYIALPGTMSDIQRRLLINGELCYDGLEQIVFKRYWNDETIKEKNGNEIRPDLNEVYKETTLFLEDFERRIGEPYAFYLKEGTNTITFEVIKEPIEYTRITFRKAEKASEYAAVIDNLKNQYEIYNGENIVCQAERATGGTTYIEKNSSSINIQKNYSDSLLEPYHPYQIKYNTIGANNWKLPGDAITWEISVPEEGLYQITFKGRQSLKRGVTSNRRLYINQTVPYLEMNAINFEYSSDMANYTVMDTEGTPYLFYLKKGSNSVTLESVMGDFGSVISEVEASLLQLNQLYLGVTQITGVKPDKFIDYQIAKKFPEFTATMAAESERLFHLVDRLVEITGEKGENTSLLQKMAIEAKGLSKDPESVTEEIGQLKENISALGTWLVAITEMPLELDSLVISAPNSKLPDAKDNIMESAYYGAIRFFASFFVKNSQISETAQASNDKTIKVWMVNAGNTTNVQSMGKEQAQIIQNLIDETFTPETGINVNLQLIPVEVVLRAALAGNNPDALIGLSQATLQDFAMRGAILDLSGMEDFDQLTEGYYQSTLDAASYMGGIYGIPEQADFFMMFYRRDILDKIGVTVPRTWEEVIKILPLLKKHNYEFFLPTVQNAANLYPSLVVQYGEDIYKGKGADYGIACNLDNEAAMQSFKLYTDFYTNYSFIVNADFPNRFREGQMPIGITRYTTFNQLEVFAPEIKGLWSFAQIPGYEKEDGTIDNSYVIETVNSAMMKNTTKQEKSWEFLQWWMSPETQLSYANTVESVMGTSARYSTANPEVMKQLPWSNSELKQLLGQMEHTVGIPAVPGNYMFTRMVLYAFNKVVAEQANPRETLYLNLKTIDKELTFKRREFNLSTQE